MNVNDWNMSFAENSNSVIKIWPETGITKNRMVKVIEATSLITDATSGKSFRVLEYWTCDGILIGKIVHSMDETPKSVDPSVH